MHPSDNRPLSNLQWSHMGAWHTSHQGNKLVPFLVFLPFSSVWDRMLRYGNASNELRNGPVDVPFSRDRSPNGVSRNLTTKVIFEKNRWIKSTISTPMTFQLSLGRIRSQLSEPIDIEKCLTKKHTSMTVSHPIVDVPLKNHMTVSRPVFQPPIW